MADFLANLPLIVLAQALGVALAWKVDAASWKHRSEENITPFSGFIRVVTWFVFFVCLTFGISAPMILVSLVVLSLLWLLLVAWVQARQLGVDLPTAFSGAWIQLGCLVLALLASIFLFPFFAFFGSGLFFFIYLVSAILAYALLSLFRPAIYETWNSYRQNSGKG